MTFDSLSPFVSYLFKLISLQPSLEGLSLWDFHVQGIGMF